MVAVFNEYSLLGVEGLLKKFEEYQERLILIAQVLATRSQIETSLLERLCEILNNQGLNIFVYIFKYEPVTRKQLKHVFPSTTVDRYLPQLEAVQAIEYRKYHYRIKRISSVNKK